MRFFLPTDDANGKESSFLPQQFIHSSLRSANILKKRILPLGVYPCTLYTNCEGYMVDGYEVGSYEQSSMPLALYINSHTIR